MTEVVGLDQETDPDLRAREHAAREVQAEVTAAVGRAAAEAPDELHLGEACAALLARLFDAERAGVTLGEPGGARTIGSFGTPAMPEPDRVRAMSPLIEQALATGRAVRWSGETPEPGDDLLAHAVAAGRRSAMVAPIPGDEGTRGIVHVSTSRERAFHEEDLRVLEHVVAVLDTGLTRLALTAALSDAAERTRAAATRVHRLGPLAEVLATCEDEQTVVEAVVRAVPGLFLAEQGGLALVEDDEAVFYEPGEGDGDGPVVRVGRIPLARSIVGLLRAGRDRVNHADPDATGCIEGEEAVRRGYPRWSIAAIRDGAGLVGSVNVATAHEDVLDTDELRLLDSLARLVGATVSRIRTRRRTERELRDAEERQRELAGRLADQAIRDPLTELLNRRGFERALSERLEGEEPGCVVAFCDLDHFKVVNDREGHHAGDRVLRRVARLLVTELPEDATIGRLGGDEFGVLFPRPDLDHARDALRVARAAVASTPFPSGTTHYALGMSAGVAACDGSQTAADALVAADTACRQAKSAGRDRVRVFAAGDREVQRQQHDMAWAPRIREALREDRLLVHAQPIVHLGAEPAQDVVHRHELLLRMRDEGGALVPPSEFLPAAERYDLTPHLDRWVLQQALRLLTEQPGIRVSTNLSPLSVADREFGQWLVQAVRDAAPPPSALAFEVTETAVVRDLDAAAELLLELRALGCRTALDDFGSGVASLGYLRRLPVDTLKLDGTLVRDADTDERAHAILSSIADLARALGLRIIAEHVETVELLETIRALGIGGVQGYALGRPVEVAALAPSGAPTPTRA